MIDWKAARECASTHILQESLNYRNLKAAHLELLRLAESVASTAGADDSLWKEMQALRKAIEESK